MNQACQYRYFIGIDVSKSELDFAVVESNQLLFHLEVSNDRKGIQTFLRQLKATTKATIHNSLFCLEHTGIYNNPLLTFLLPKQASIWVEKATQLRESMGVSRIKNDKVDAIKIARYAYKNWEDAHLWQPKREIVEQLDRLTAIRKRLVSAIHMLNVPLTESTGFVSKSDLKNDTKTCTHSLTALKKDLKGIDAAIREVINSDPELNSLFEIVTSIKGVGVAVATEIIITTNEFKDFKDPKKFACYAGVVVPFEQSSGRKRGKPQVSRIANKKVKALLHLAALSASRHSDEFRAYCDRKVAEGKNKMLVLNNIRNKIVLRIFACVRRGQKYENIYSSPLV
ncbi:IS110 family RNA-guided transposase [Spirosoma jeollabukense]